MTITVDSSVIIAALREQEDKHRACLRLLERIKQGHFVAIEPCTVLVEVSAAIKRRTGSEKLAEGVKASLRNLSSIRFCDIENDRADEASDIAIRTGLRGMDAVVVQIAREFKATLVTLDTEMAEKAKDIVKVRPPEKLI